MSNRTITEQVLPNDFKRDGEILYGRDVNKIVSVFKEAINGIKKDLDTLVGANSSVIVKYSTEALYETEGYLGQRGFVFLDNGLYFYLYTSTGWALVKEIDLMSMLAGNPEFETLKLSTTTGLTQEEVTDPGTMFYDIERHTVTLLTDLGEYLELGSNLGDFGKNVDNSIGVPPTIEGIYEGAPVALSGAQGGHKLFVRADASNPDLSAMIGVLTTSTSENGYGQLEYNDFGKVSVFGEVTIPNFTKIMEANDTSGLQFGSKLYLSAVDPGRYTLVEPQKPHTSIWVATVTDFNQANNRGKLFIFPHRQRSEIQGNEFFVTDEAETPPTYAIEDDIWFHCSNS